MYMFFCKTLPPHNVFLELYNAKLNNLLKFPSKVMKVFRSYLKFIQKKRKRPAYGKICFLIKALNYDTALFSTLPEVFDQKLETFSLKDRKKIVQLLNSSLNYLFPSKHSSRRGERSIDNYVGFFSDKCPKRFC